MEPQFKVSLEIATNEINAWLDSRKVSESKREEKEQSVDKLIQAIAYGNLTYDAENGQLKQILTCPVGAITHLDFKNRLTHNDIAARLQKVSAEDWMGVIKGYVCALTNQPTQVVGMLDMDDYNIAQSVASFFL